MMERQTTSPVPVRSLDNANIIASPPFGAWRESNFEWDIPCLYCFESTNKEARTTQIGKVSQIFSVVVKEEPTSVTKGTNIITTTFRNFYIGVSKGNAKPNPVVVKGVFVSKVVTPIPPAK